MNFAVPISPSQSIDLSHYLSLAAKHRFSQVSLDTELPHCSYRQHTGRLQLISEARAAKVGFDALHIPVNQHYDLSSKDAETRMGAAVKIALLMSAGRDLGCRVIVLTVTHALPSQYGSDTESALHAMEGLVETAEIMGVKLALRNLIDAASLETLAALLAAYSSPNLGLCYDPALEYLADTEPYELLHTYGNRIVALNLNDTDGKSRTGLPPFSGEIDWQMVCSLISTEQLQFPLALGVEQRSLGTAEQYFETLSESRDRLAELLAIG